MIHLAVNHIVNTLNDYVNLRTGELGRVVQNNLLDQSGNEIDAVDGKVVMSLVNLAEDPACRSVNGYQRQDDGNFHKVEPEVRLYLYLLFIANLNDYTEALKSLAHVISCFQKKNYFDYAEISGLENRDGRLVLELYSLTFEQLNHLWGSLGAKYRPSVLYRVRIVSIQEEQIEAVIPGVGEIEIRP